MGMPHPTPHPFDKAALLRRVREGSISPEAAIASLRAGAATPPVADEPWPAPFLRDLVSLIGTLLHRPPDQIDLDGAVADMGLDSLSATEFSNHVRARWGLSLSATAFFECNTVRDFQQYMLRIHGPALQARYAAATGTETPVRAQSVVQPPAALAPAEPAAVRADPIRATLQRLWQAAEQDLALHQRNPRGLKIDRLTFERPGMPAIEICQAGSGEPVLLLGGLMNPDGIWHRQVDALVRQHQVVIFNKPGCGRSGVDVRRLSIESIVNDLVAALDALHITAPLAVVGFSFGGLLTQALAHRHPGRVARMALINTTACTRARPDDVQILKDELARCPEVSQINGEIDFALAACYRDVSRGFDLRAALPSLRMPALVLSASRDSYVDASQSRELAHLLPHAQHIEIADAGHFSLLTHADRVNRALLDFLRSGAMAASKAAGEVLA